MAREWDAERAKQMEMTHDLLGPIDGVSKATYAPTLSALQVRLANLQFAICIDGRTRPTGSSGNPAYRQTEMLCRISNQLDNLGVPQIRDPAEPITVDTIYRQLYNALDKDMTCRPAPKHNDAEVDELLKLIGPNVHGVFSIGFYRPVARAINQIATIHSNLTKLGVMPAATVVDRVQWLSEQGMKCRPAPKCDDAKIHASHDLLDTLHVPRMFSLYDRLRFLASNLHMQIIETLDGTRTVALNASWELPPR